MRRLGLATDLFSSHAGGQEQYVAEIVRALTERGWEIDLLACRAEPHSDLPRGATLHRSAWPRMLAARGLALAIARYRRDHSRCPVLATRPIPGATHCQLHTGVYAEAFAAERDSFSSRLRRAGYWPALRVNPRRQRLLRDEARVLSARGGASIMTFSRRSSDDVCRRFGLNANRMRVIPLGVDRRHFHPDGRIEAPRAVTQLLFAGHNFELKGLTSALIALAKVRAKGLDARLVVAGNGRITTARRRARRLGVNAAVDFAGSVSPHQMPQLYRSSHLLVHPTFYDPFSRVVIEALACGTPVVTTTGCGAGEHLTPGREGFLVSHARDVDAIAEAIVACLDPRRWESFSRGAAALGAQFDFVKHVDELEDWLTTDRETLLR